MIDSRDDLPFQAVVPPPAEHAAPTDDLSSVDGEDSEWSLDALEDAYQRALESADAAAAQVELETPDALGNASDAVVSAVGETPAAPAVEAFRASEQVRPEQILEALLFVGGDPLTSRRLADLLGGDSMHGVVDDAISELNASYAEQGRPYHILLGEGGYRLTLRPEFDTVRNRVFGVGPRDVRLSQDALEVLALIAYQQPMTREAVEETGKPNVAALLRQLLRLELISLERGSAGKDDIRYRTTVRFLHLFALDRIEDLPRPEDLMLR